MWAAGSHVVNVTDSKGCPAFESSVSISSPDGILCSISLLLNYLQIYSAVLFTSTTKTTSCHNSADGTIEVVATGGNVGGYRYWV